MVKTSSVADYFSNIFLLNLVIEEDYNAGYTGALAGMIDYYLTHNSTFIPFNDGQLDLGWSHPNAVQALKPNYPADDCYHLNVPCPGR